MPGTAKGSRPSIRERGLGTPKERGPFTCTGVRVVEEKKTGRGKKIRFRMILSVTVRGLQKECGVVTLLWQRFGKKPLLMA